MNIFEYTRKELVDNYDQLINLIRNKFPYHGRLPIHPSELSTFSIYSKFTDLSFIINKYTPTVNTIKINENLYEEYEEYAKYLHKKFVDNPKLQEIIRIAPNITLPVPSPPAAPLPAAPLPAVPLPAVPLPAALLPAALLPAALLPAALLPAAPLPANINAQVNRIDVDKLIEYNLYVYNDDFIIETKFIDKIIEYNFIYPVYNYDDYVSIDFIRYIKNSLFDDEDYIINEIYLNIYKYYKEYINDPISKDLIEIRLEYKELKWDMLKQYLLYQPDKVVDYIEKNKYDISLLINTINLIYDSNININTQEYDQLVPKWIAEYLNWYNLEGKKSIDYIKSLDIFEHEYDIVLYDYEKEDENGNDINLGYLVADKKYNYIDNYGKYAIIPKHVENNIDILINQLYYKLAEYYMHNDINTTSEDDKKNILDYLEKSGDYKDAKELKNKLFYEYIGLSFGQEYDIDLNNLTMSTLYDLVKIIKK